MWRRALPRLFLPKLDFVRIVGWGRGFLRARAVIGQAASDFPSASAAVSHHGHSWAAGES